MSIRENQLFLIGSTYLNADQMYSSYTNSLLLDGFR